MLHFVRSVSSVIWRVKRYVCFWTLYFSKPTISSTVITFFSVRVCFSLPVLCHWLVLHVSTISVNNIPTLSLLQFIFKNSASILRKRYFLNRYKFLIRALSPLRNGTLHHRYIFCALKITIYDNIMLSFTNIRNVYKTKQFNFCIKIGENFFQNTIFFAYVLVILVIFENLCFTW